MFFLVGAVTLSLFLSVPAAADFGDCSFSGAVAAQSTPGVLVASGLRYGLLDLFSLELEAGLGVAEVGELELLGQGRLGVVTALDIFEWVPELIFGVGAQWTAADIAPFAWVEARLRWVLDFNWSVFVGGGADYFIEKSRFNGTAHLGVSYLLD